MQSTSKYTKSGDSVEKLQKQDPDLMECYYNHHLVNCSNVFDGCTWIGKLNSLNEHLKTCQYKRIYCSNIGCHWTGQLYKLDNHLQKCRWSILQCVNSGCEWTGELHKLANHLKICPYQLVKCLNHCTKDNKPVELLRKYMGDHLQSHCPNRIIQCAHCKKMGIHADISTTHLKSECQKVKSPCTNEGCNACIPRDKLFNHRHDHCLYERIHCKYFHIGCNTVLLRKDHESHESNKRLHLHLALETFSNMYSGIADRRSSSTQDGYSFTVPNFNDHKTKDMAYFSPPFYTKPGGYKMCIRVDANGWMDGYKKSVSVYTYFMRGENDDNLVWPFRGSVTIILLNQIGKHHNHKITIVYTENRENGRVTMGDISSCAWGTAHYISPHKLINIPEYVYLKDDCLLFRVTVDALEPIKPWLTCSKMDFYL